MKVYLVSEHWESKPYGYYDPDKDVQDVTRIFATRELARQYIRGIAEEYEKDAAERKHVDFVYHFEENEDDIYGPMDPGAYEQVIFCINTYEVVEEL